MDTQQRLGFGEMFETGRSPHPIFCHQEFLESLALERNTAIGRRASYVMQRLTVDPRRLHYKPTYGENRGWRRSRLGGSQGSHFYLWWAPKNAAPLRESDGFAESPEGAVFVRAIRHHDNHSPLPPQSLAEHYLPVSVGELRGEEYGPAPWTQTQTRFAQARQRVRLLKGHPGSGKTTALWHAADSSGAERILYITYSRDLAALARDYFDRYCSSHKHFDVVVFPQLVRQILGSSAPVSPERDMLRRFSQDLAGGAYVAPMFVVMYAPHLSRKSADMPMSGTYDAPPGCKRCMIPACLLITYPSSPALYKHDVRTGMVLAAYGRIEVVERLKGTNGLEHQE